MQFVEAGWPILVAISGKQFTEEELAAMRAGYERYFERGERYALIVASVRGAERPGATARKSLADWAGTPRVREYSSKLCVGSATLVANPLMKGALTAIMWFWKPAMPHQAVTSLDEGLDYCFRQLAGARVALPRDAAALRRDVETVVRPII